MALEIEAGTPWRSSTLARLGNPRVAHVTAVNRGRKDGIMDTDSHVGDVGSKKWLDAGPVFKYTDGLVRKAMMDGRIGLVVEVGSKQPTSVDNAMSAVRELPYDYSDKSGVVMRFADNGKHVVVKPKINDTVVDAMYAAPTADKWVAATGIKLPRTIAANSQPGAVAGLPSSGLPNITSGGGFDELRREVASFAREDDYGDRLFNLARIVLHAQVVDILGIPVNVTPAMRALNAHSIAAADTPYLTLGQMSAYTFLNVGTDYSEDYRAFLAMGVRGVENYAGVSATIYSECHGAAEASSDSELVYVRIGGVAPSVIAPGPQAYISVLSNPRACLAYYHAYAASVGVGRLAATILAQAALAPHIWHKEAISPYKDSRPRLDAAAYVLLPDVDTAHTQVVDVFNLVAEAAVLAQAYNASIGGLILSFGHGKHIAPSAILRELDSRFGDPEVRRGSLLSVCKHLRVGTVGLEWLSPFSVKVSDGYQLCTAAWRDYAFLLGMFHCTPISHLAGLFDSGIDMRNALIVGGLAKSGAEYCQLVAVSIAAQAEVIGYAERVDVALQSALAPLANRMREWVSVVTLVRLVNSRLAETPATPSSGAVYPSGLPLEMSPDTRGRTSGQRDSSRTRSTHRSVSRPRSAMKPVARSRSRGAARKQRLELPKAEALAAEDKVAHWQGAVDSRPQTNHRHSTSAASEPLAVPARKHTRTISGSSPEALRLPSNASTGTVMPMRRTEPLTVPREQSTVRQESMAPAPPQITSRTAMSESEDDDPVAVKTRRLEWSDAKRAQSVTSTATSALTGAVNPGAWGGNSKKDVVRREPQTRRPTQAPKAIAGKQAAAESESDSSSESEAEAKKPAAQIKTSPERKRIDAPAPTASAEVALKGDRSVAKSIKSVGTTNTKVVSAKNVRM